MVAYGSRAHTVRHGGTGVVAGMRERQLVTGSRKQEVNRKWGWDIKLEVQPW